jgi:DNA-binding Xre family transcriptional regulator
MTVPPIAVGPAEAAKALGISRARLYSIKLGKSRLIRVEVLHAYLEQLEREQNTNDTSR